MQIRFPSEQIRSSFIALLKREDPYLFDHVRALYSQPTVAVVTGIDAPSSARLRALVTSFSAGAAQTYSDAQMKTFGT